MAFIATPNTAEVDILGNLFGQIIENTLYFETPGGWIESSLIALATAVGEWFVTEVLPTISYSYSYQRTEAKDISVASGAFATSVADTGTLGGLVADAAPGNVCLAVQFKTGLSGRSYRGRNYVSALPGTSLLGNQCNPTLADAIVAAYNALPGYVVDDLPDAEWVVVSKYSGGAPRAAGVTTPVTVCTLANYDIDSQRRRLTGRGQ